MRVTEPLRGYPHLAVGQACGRRGGGAVGRGSDILVVGLVFLSRCWGLPSGPTFKGQFFILFGMPLCNGTTKHDLCVHFAGGVSPLKRIFRAPPS